MTLITLFVHWTIDVFIIKYYTEIIQWDVSSNNYYCRWDLSEVRIYAHNLYDQLVVYIIIVIKRETCFLLHTTGVELEVFYSTKIRFKTMYETVTKENKKHNFNLTR